MKETPQANSQQFLLVDIDTLSKKRNATSLTVLIFPVLIIGQKMHGYSFIRHVIDMFVVIILVEHFSPHYP